MKPFARDLLCTYSSKYESIWVASKVSVTPSLTLHATHCIHTSMNVRKMKIS